MGEDAMCLGAEQRRRVRVLELVVSGELTIRRAAEVLGLSERHAKRLTANYRRAGAAALIDGNTGRAPWHAVSVEVRAWVVALARGPYAGFNHQHLSELLAEAEGLPLSRPTVWRIRLEGGLASPRPRRARQHRRRRERLPREGMLLQADGSRHRWLGPERPYLRLLGAIDDATGVVGRQPGRRLSRHHHRDHFSPARRAHPTGARHAPPRHSRQPRHRARRRPCARPAPGPRARSTPGAATEGDKIPAHLS